MSSYLKNCCFIVHCQKKKKERRERERDGEEVLKYSTELSFQRAASHLKKKKKEGRGEGKRKGDNSMENGQRI